jgi:hypothetical protein
MGLFKKKEEIPKIPTASSLPALPELQPLEQVTKEPAKKDLPGLPSFPADTKNEALNQGIIKSAVSDSPSPKEAESYPEASASIHVEEMPKEKPTLPLKPDPKNSIPELPELSKLPEPTALINPEKVESQKLAAPILPEAPIQSPPHQAQYENQSEPIFVRIDKFQAAQKNFDEIKSKVAEIELVLQKIKDVKSQEDEELKGWTKDTEKLKSRLAEIDSGLFSQL